MTLCLSWIRECMKYVVSSEYGGHNCLKRQEDVDEVKWEGSLTLSNTITCQEISSYILPWAQFWVAWVYVRLWQQTVSWMSVRPSVHRLTKHLSVSLSHIISVMLRLQRVPTSVGLTTRPNELRSLSLNGNTVEAASYGRLNHYRKHASRCEQHSNIRPGVVL
jgi:hypothetical protein